MPVTSSVKILELFSKSFSTRKSLQKTKKHSTLSKTTKTDSEIEM